jgi:lipid-binding SYLF domain-containing protein
MIKRLFASALLGALVMAGGCTTTGSTSGDPKARAAAIDAGVDSMLSELYRQAPGSDQLVKNAKGVLVFPAVISAAFVFGASTGDGALREGGKTTRYYRKTGGSVGLQAGAASQAVFLLFMTDEALNRFKASNGWTVGADASVTLLNVGATAQVTTNTAQQAVVGYVLSNSGLMAGVSLDGTRIVPLNL